LSFVSVHNSFLQETIAMVRRRERGEKEKKIKKFNLI
jgi:hypothetical protein